MKAHISAVYPNFCTVTARAFTQASETSPVAMASKEPANATGVIKSKGRMMGLNAKGMIEHIKMPIVV